MAVIGTLIVSQHSHDPQEMGDNDISIIIGLKELKVNEKKLFSIIKLLKDS